MKLYPVLAQGSSKPLGAPAPRNGADSYFRESEFCTFFGVDDITLATSAVSPGLWRHRNIIMNTYCQGDFTPASQLLNGQYAKYG